MRWGITFQGSTRWLCLAACLMGRPVNAGGPDLAAIADDELRLRLSVEYLSCFESRMTGHPGNAQAAAWIEAQLRELDLGGPRLDL